MPYASQEKIQLHAGGLDALVQLADDNRDGNVDADVIAEAQLHADQLINSYAHLRFAALVNAGGAPADAAIAVAADEAVYWLRRRKPGLTSDDDRKDHEERIAWLEKLARGGVRPGEPLPAKSTAVRGVHIEREGDITRATLKGTFT